MEKRKGDERDGSGPDSKRARPSSTVTVSEGKLVQLWGSKHFTKEKLGSLQLDETAMYSVTDARTADRITKLALSLPGMAGEDTKFCDGCACVGGNVISFARALTSTSKARVSAVEVDESRFHMLENNVQVAGLSARCFRGDLPSLLLEGSDSEARAAVRGCDLLFLDPPWGGPQVGSMPDESVELDMSSVTMTEIARRVAGPEFATRHLLLKLPPNYMFAKLIADLADVADISLERAFRKMVLVVITFKRPPAKKQAPLGVADAAKKAAASPAAAGKTSSSSGNVDAPPTEEPAPAPEPDNPPRRKRFESDADEDDNPPPRKRFESDADEDE